MYSTSSGGVYDDILLSGHEGVHNTNDSIIMKLENGIGLSPSSNTMTSTGNNNDQSSNQQVNCQGQNQNSLRDNRSKDNNFRRTARDIRHSTNQILDELDMLSGGPDALNLVCPSPLVPFQNRIVRWSDRYNTSGHDYHGKFENSTTPFTVTATTATERLIPQILHVSMKSRCLPRDLARIMDRWKTRFPNYSIFFHDDDAVQRLITGEEWPEFPGFHRAMKCVLLKGAMVIDIWRVLLLWKYGGVYTDIDNWPEDAFTEDLIPGNLTAFFFSDPNNRPSQWFMALEPRHPIMYDSMLHVIQHIFEMRNLRQPQVVQVTGPFAIRMGYAVFLSRLRKDGMEAVFRNDKVLIGTAGKSVYKSSNGYYQRRLKNKFISLKKGYDDIVPWNTTLNVTRRERIEMESGVLHWQRDRNEIVRIKSLPKVSCQRYLKMLDEKEVEEVSNQATNRTK
jgi:hypothetical protein